MNNQEILAKIDSMIRDLQELKRHIGCEVTSPPVASLAGRTLQRPGTPIPTRTLAASALAQAPDRSRQFAPLPGERRPLPLPRLFSENFVAADPPLMTPEELIGLSKPSTRQYTPVPMPGRFNRA